MIRVASVGTEQPWGMLQPANLKSGIAPISLISSNLPQDFHVVPNLWLKNKGQEVEAGMPYKSF